MALETSIGQKDIFSERIISFDKRRFRVAHPIREKGKPVSNGCKFQICLSRAGAGRGVSENRVKH
jgi:hypothetical protein